MFEVMVVNASQALNYYSPMLTIFQEAMTWNHSLRSYRPPCAIRSDLLPVNCRVWQILTNDPTLPLTLDVNALAKFGDQIMFTFKDFETDLLKGHNEKEAIDKDPSPPVTARSEFVAEERRHSGLKGRTANELFICVHASFFIDHSS
nr:hypothetical protein CFP56_76603 [Quercus suber]